MMAGAAAGNSTCRRILDLGSGCGRDVCALAHLVGASGQVVSVDMTYDQLAVAAARHAG